MNVNKTIVQFSLYCSNHTLNNLQLFTVYENIKKFAVQVLRILKKGEQVS